MITIVNAVKSLTKAGFTVEPTTAKHILIARKDGSDTITVYRNGGENFDIVAMFQIGRSDLNVYAQTVPRAVKLAALAVIGRAPVAPVVRNVQPHEWDSVNGQCWCALPFNDLVHRD
jgi:hypothetical protein